MVEILIYKLCGPRDFPNLRDKTNLGDRLRIPRVEMDSFLLCFNVEDRRGLMFCSRLRTSVDICFLVF